MNQQQIFFEAALKKVNSILNLIGLVLSSDKIDGFLARIPRPWFYIFIVIWLDTDFAAQLAWLVNGVMTGKTLVELTCGASTCASILLINVKSYYFYKNEQSINDLIVTLRKLINASGNSRPEFEKEMKQRYVFLTRVSKIQYRLTVMAYIAYSFVPLIITTHSYFTSGEVELVLPFVVLYPFEVQDKRIFLFMYLRQVSAGLVGALMIVGIDTFYYMCCAFIDIQFHCLYYDMERIITGKFGENTIDRFRSKFAECMERHKELIRCVSLMEQIYSKSTLANVTLSSVFICLVGFNCTALDSWPVMTPFINSIFLALGQIYIICYYGDTIMRSSAAISKAAYNSKWYLADVKVMKHILLVLVRAQTPCKLTAYGFSDINLITFGRILSTAWSYFALLSTLHSSM